MKGGVVSPNECNGFIPTFNKTPLYSIYLSLLFFVSGFLFILRSSSRKEHPPLISDDDDDEITTIRNKRNKRNVMAKE